MPLLGLRHKEDGSHSRTGNPRSTPCEIIPRMTRELTSAEYGLLIENSPVMIWRAGLDASCDYFNDTWLSFTGRTLEQELGNGWAEGVHPEDLDRCVSYYLESFRQQRPFE